MRRILGAGGAVLAQVITAVGSLLLQLIAARELGAAGFAAFTLLNGALVVMATLHTAWVGDSLTVLDRFDPRVRAGLFVSLLGTLALGAVVGTVLALAFGALPGARTLLFGVLVVVWLAEDTGRRLLAARMEFARLARNDGLHLLTTCVVLVVVHVTAGIDLEWLLVAMAAGCVVSIFLVLLQAPREELALPPLRGADVRGVGVFAAWRAAQAVLRPTTLLLARIAIAALVSSTALAATEAARLLLAPTLTLINGVGGFLLPRMVRLREAGHPLRARLALTASVALTSVSAVSALVAVLLTGPLEHLITAGRFDVDPVTVAGWGAYCVSIAATMPVSLLATAYRHSRLVFEVRLIESVIGLAVLAVMLVWRPDLFGLAPFYIGTGGVVTSVVLVIRLHALRSETGPHVPVKADR
ncbi:hypothetical protein F5972_23815 [Microbispora cellulosiformans]|uniref:Oligosaccharide flippase family protein n=1 Tax=Microbispora cellulosiformans TaxID=2614688 RepID=A0A5J5K0L0_9ACTN|nr:hypothetical protein [Microbispora cellulosiformans]KAA9376443.1 hypothetical protein F5972_23815 [Microbispora cellulosiformans]